MDQWAQQDVDLVAPGFIQFDRHHAGTLGFMAIEGDVDWRPRSPATGPAAEFSWEGFDEGDPVCGRGWVAVQADGSLLGHLYLRHGDDSAFRAERLTGSSGAAPT